MTQVVNSTFNLYAHFIEEASCLSFFVNVFVHFYSSILFCKAWFTIAVKILGS